MEIKFLENLFKNYFSKSLEKRSNYDKNHYYFHGTEDESAATIESIFNEGLKSKHGINLTSTTTSLDTYGKNAIKKLGIEELMKRYVGGNYKSVFLIKIPKEYMAKENSKDFPVPFFKLNSESEDLKNMIIIPNLIYGVYNLTLNIFIKNPNYNPIYNPSGMYYSQEQIDNLYSHNNESAYEALSFILKRQKIAKEELFEYDQKSKVLMNLMNHYSKTIKENRKQKEFLKDFYEQKLLENNQK